MNEQNKARNALWRTFLVVPHKDLKQPVDILREALASDPDFVGKMCLALNMRRFNSIRDLAEAGLITLLTSPSEFQIMRKSGRVLFGSLAPYQAIRVSDYIDEHLFPNRHVRSAVASYLKTLTHNPTRFEGAFLRNRKGLRRLYIRYHLTDPLAQAYIFNKKPPEDSQSALLKKI